MSAFGHEYMDEDEEREMVRALSVITRAVERAFPVGRRTVEQSNGLTRAIIMISAVGAHSAGCSRELYLSIHGAAFDNFSELED